MDEREGLGDYVHGSMRKQRVSEHNGRTYAESGYSSDRVHATEVTMMIPVWRSSRRIVRATVHGVWGLRSGHAR